MGTVPAWVVLVVVVLAVLAVFFQSRRIQKYGELVERALASTDKLASYYQTAVVPQLSRATSVSQSMMDYLLKEQERARLETTGKEGNGA